MPNHTPCSSRRNRYILEHSESKLLFVGKLDEKPWAEMKEGIPAAITRISFPLCPKGNPADKQWEKIISKAQPIEKPVKRVPDEMATIIYTSGSTGK